MNYYLLPHVALPNVVPVSLPYKLKMQYVHLKSIDTSMERTISLQFTAMLKSALHMFYTVDTALLL